MYRHSSGNLYVFGNTSAGLSVLRASMDLSLFDPVTPNAASTSAGVSRRPASAPCATGAFVAVVVVAADDDEEGLLWLLSPQETTNIPAAATAIAADSWRIRECPSAFVGSSSVRAAAFGLLKSLRME